MRTRESIESMCASPVIHASTGFQRAAPLFTTSPRLDTSPNIAPIIAYSAARDRLTAGGYHLAGDTQVRHAPNGPTPGPNCKDSVRGDGDGSDKNDSHWNDDQERVNIPK
jgi:hypothetical protein